MELTCIKNYFTINKDDEFESSPTIEHTSNVFWVFRCVLEGGVTSLLCPFWVYLGSEGGGYQRWN